MGYDDKGNLVGVGESSYAIYLCAVLAGSKSMQTLEADFTIDFAGGTTWDGKYFAFADQESGGELSDRTHSSEAKRHDVDGGRPDDPER